MREHRTQAERRAASRAALLEAAVDCLIKDGYANLTTRRVAERAGVSQGTQMHYFPTKTQFLTEAIRHVAQRLAREALARANFDEPDELARYEAILEELWRIHNGPLFQATLELWIAARTDRGLASAMRKLEREVTQLMLDSAGALLPDRLIAAPGDPQRAQEAQQRAELLVDDPRAGGQHDEHAVDEQH